MPQAIANEYISTKSRAKEIHDLVSPFSDFHRPLMTLTKTQHELQTKLSKLDKMRSFLLQRAILQQFGTSKLETLHFIATAINQFFTRVIKHYNEEKVTPTASRERINSLLANYEKTVIWATSPLLEPQAQALITIADSIDDACTRSINYMHSASVSHTMSTDTIEAICEVYTSTQEIAKIHKDEILSAIKNKQLTAKFISSKHAQLQGCTDACDNQTRTNQALDDGTTKEILGFWQKAKALLKAFFNHLLDRIKGNSMPSDLITKNEDTEKDATSLAAANKKLQEHKAEQKPAMEQKPISKVTPKTPLPSLSVLNTKHVLPEEDKTTAATVSNTFDC